MISICGAISFWRWVIPTEACDGTLLMAGFTVTDRGLLLKGLVEPCRFFCDLRAKVADSGGNSRSKRRKSSPRISSVWTCYDHEAGLFDIPFVNIDTLILLRCSNPVGLNTDLLIKFGISEPRCKQLQNFRAISVNECLV